MCARAAHLSLSLSLPLDLKTKVKSLFLFLYLVYVKCGGVISNNLRSLRLHSARSLRHMIVSGPRRFLGGHPSSTLFAPPMRRVTMIFCRTVAIRSSTEIGQIDGVQLGARRILEQGGAILALALFHPVAVHAERAAIDDLAGWMEREQCQQMASK